MKLYSIKPLKWNEEGEKDLISGDDWEMIAESPQGSYRIEKSDNGVISWHYYFAYPYWVGYDVKNIDEAKQACQKDWTERMQKCLNEVTNLPNPNN